MNVTSSTSASMTDDELGAGLIEVGQQIFGKRVTETFFSTGLIGWFLIRSSWQRFQ